jgi:hypothetical protein
MLSDIKLSAIAVGLLILVVTSVVNFFVGTTGFAWAISIESRPIAVAFILLVFSFISAAIWPQATARRRFLELSRSCTVQFAALSELAPQLHSGTICSLPSCSVFLPRLPGLG